MTRPRVYRLHRWIRPLWRVIRWQHGTSLAIGAGPVLVVFGARPW